MGTLSVEQKFNSLHCAEHSVYNKYKYRKTYKVYIYIAYSIWCIADTYIIISIP